jgi:integrase/recombinase XerC
VNPFGALPSPRKDKRLPQVLGQSQVGELLDSPARWRATQPDDDAYATYAAARDGAMLEVLYSTGMRLNELTQLRESQVDLLSGMVKVEGKGKKQRLCRAARGNGGPRALPARHRCPWASGRDLSQQVWQAADQSIGRAHDEKIPAPVRS